MGVLLFCFLIFMFYLIFTKSDGDRKSESINKQLSRAYDDYSRECSLLIDRHKDTLFLNGKIK